MKVFRTMFNTIQAIALIMLTYYTLGITIFNYIPNDGSTLTNFIIANQSWIIMLEIVLLVSTFILLSTKNKLTIKILGIINLIIYAIFYILGRNTLDIILITDITVLASGNTLIAVLSKID